MDRIYRKKEVDIWSEALYEGGGGGSKPFITVDFALRFVMIIESTNFEHRFY
jgi:hypothetical protein